MDANRIPLKLFSDCVIAVMLTEWLVALWGKLIPLPPLIIIGMIRLLQAGLMVWIISRWPGGFTLLGFGKSRFLHGLKQGIIWSLGFGIAAALAGLILYLGGVNPFRLIRISLPEQITDIALLFIVGGIIGPLAEEFFFRGVLYGFFRQWGVLTAILGSSALFVALHSSAGITQAVGGLVFAAAYEKEKSLMAPIVIHVSGNLALFGLSLVLR